MNAQYEINFATNTIIVSKAFLRAASMIGTTEYSTMTELRKLGMPITTRVIRRASEHRWSFSRMMKYISNTDHSEKYMADFKVLKESYPYMSVWKWFKATFPDYHSVPKFNKDHKIIVKLPVRDGSIDADDQTDAVETAKQAGLTVISQDAAA